MTNRVRLMAALAGLLLLAGCSNQPLYSQLDEQQANEVTAALIQSNLHAEKRPAKDKGWEVMVPTGEFPQAMQVVHARGLPRETFQTMCDIFKKEGFSSSSTEERGRYLCGLQQELSRTISSIPGVVDARVHIAMPEKDVLAATPTQASASVVVYQQSDVNVSGRETDIKVIVKDGVEGLDDINRVTVKFFTMPPPTMASGSAMGFMAGIDVPRLLMWVAAIGIGLLLLRFVLGRLRRPPPPPAASASREVTLGEQMSTLINEMRNG